MRFKDIITSLILILCVGQAKSIFAQGAIDSLLLKKKQLEVNVNVLGLAINYEKRTGKVFTTNYEMGLSYSFYLGGGSLIGERYSYELSPVFSIDNRWYYNLYKRKRKARNVANNAANFLSAKVGYRLSPLVSKNLNDNPVIVLNPSWGIQRNFGKRINFEVAPGYLFLFDTTQKQWSGRVNISMKVGYVIF